MIRDNQKGLNRIHIVVDAVVVAVSYLLAWYIKFVILNKDATIGILSRETYFSALRYIIPGYLILFYYCDLYSSRRYSSVEREIFNIIKANTLGLGVVIVGMYTFKVLDFSRSMMFIFYAFTNVLVIAERQVIRSILRTIRRRGYNVKYVLLVGYSRAAETYIDRILENPQWGYVVCGILDDHLPTGTVYRGVKVLGTLANLDVILELEEKKLDEIGISLSLQDYDYLEELVRACEKSGVHTKFIPDYNGVIPTNPYIEDLTGLAVVNIRYVPLTNTMNMLVKRMIDFFGSIILIILFSPVMLISAVLIKLTDGGKVIFAQERVGLHNRTFKMYKFRTMREQKEEEEKEGWTKKDDPRVTAIGKFLRRTSLDELPQFFNVLLGQMSLVGPRPERPQFVEKFKEDIPGYKIKHQVRPGITGWAQVNGFRGDTSIRRRIECDLYYIEHWTLMMDFKILFMTIFKGFINKNAY